ncbi:Cyanophycinase [Streptosporangium subroseum]|uniref:Cyanophycinase n=1 Tax=Streptosporangium subroseum TaxID=106412 RepID=A0A239NZX3_9ACTN|nr:Type 1 glutamine amidotransferase-like domain-containing protein [Streptosporangium subroseum]SNT60376.1 Cyanophycinase [Streptosporangium subroseum]
MPGPIALIGQNDIDTRAELDRHLLERSGGNEVLLIPTATVEWPRARATELLNQRVGFYEEKLGTKVTVPEVFSREDAHDPAHIQAVEKANYIFLTGGRPKPLAEILRGTPLWRAILDRWQAGAVLAGESAGAVVLTEYVIDSEGVGKGGKGPVVPDPYWYTYEATGLGLLPGMRVLPHSDTAKGQWMLTSMLAATSIHVPILAVPENAGVVRGPDGDWITVGAPGVVVFHKGAHHSLDALAAVEPNPEAGI